MMSSAALRVIAPGPALSQEALKIVTPKSIQNSPFGMMQNAFSSPSGTNDYFKQQQAQTASLLSSYSPPPAASSASGNNKSLLGQ